MVLVSNLELYYNGTSATLTTSPILYNKLYLRTFMLLIVACSCMHVPLVHSRAHNVTFIRATHSYNMEGLPQLAIQLMPIRFAQWFRVRHNWWYNILHISIVCMHSYIP